MTIERHQVAGTGGINGAPVDTTGASVGDVPTATQLTPLTFGTRAGAADIVAHRPTGVVATDKAMLLQAIADTPSGGKLWIPSVGDTPYAIDAPLVIAKHITIEGNSLSDNFTSVTSGGELGTPSNSLAQMLLGSVIMQVTAGANVLNLTGSGIAAHLRRLGLTWASAIRYTNTGHGVWASPTQTFAGGGGFPAGGHDSGLMSYTMADVSVAGNDGNHYGFYLLNAMYGRMDHLRVYGGGGLHLEVDSFRGNFGNLVCSDLYVNLLNAGTAAGVRLSARVAYPANGGVLNLLTFIRPQVNLTGDANVAGTQYAWNNNGGPALPYAVTLIDPDMEIEPTSSACNIDFGGVGSGTRVLGSTLLSKAPLGGYDGAVGYRRYTATGSFVVPRGVLKVRARAVGAGGGGGGGGSALTAGGVTNQVGGAGGGAGLVAEATVDVTPGTTYTVTVGTGGTAGTAAAANGAAGGAGGTGGRSSFHTDLVRADGGGGGEGGLANVNTARGGGRFGASGSPGALSASGGAANVPGYGSNAQNPNGLTSVPMPPGVVGGSGAGAANATLGGGRGNASQVAFPAYTGQGGGSGATSATANGVDGQTAITPGCGGGGGGGGAPGGTGGAGALGAPGMVEVWW